MTDPYEREERIALIADGCKVSQAEAQAIYDRNQHISPNHYAEKIERIRSLGTLQKLGKRKIVDGKTLAGGW